MTVQFYGNDCHWHFNLYEKVLFVHLNITGRERDTGKNTDHIFGKQRTRKVWMNEQ